MRVELKPKNHVAQKKFLPKLKRKTVAKTNNLQTKIIAVAENVDIQTVHLLQQLILVQFQFTKSNLIIIILIFLPKNQNFIIQKPIFLPVLLPFGFRQK